MRKVLFVLFVISGSWTAYANQPDIYISDAGAGLMNGTSCANAQPHGFYNTAANWDNGAGHIGPGTNVHFCGSFAVPVNNGSQNVYLFAQGSGTLGNNINHVWEPGASFTSADMYIAFSTLSGPALGGTKQSFLSYDGNCTVSGKSPGLAGSTCATPSITNTANGTNLANHVASAGIFSDTCNNCEFKNLSITNIYVNVPDVDTLGSVTLNLEVDNASHIKIHDNFLSHAAFGLLTSFANNSTDYQVYNNTMTNCQHCAEMKGNGTTGIAPTLVMHDNHVNTTANWDLANQSQVSYHHNGFGPISGNINCDGPNVLDTIKIYNNLFDGDQGTEFVTAWVFVNCGITHLYVFNNVFIMSAASGGNSVQLGFSATDPNADLNYYQVNNTYVALSGVAAAFIKQWSGTNIQIQNNALTGSGGGQPFYLATGGNPITTSGFVIDYNAYDLAGSGSGHAFQWNSTGQTYTVYKAQNPPFEAHSITPASLGLDANNKPTVGSALIGAGVNLTSLCSTVPELCFDKAGIPRPVGGSWDIGAFQGSGTAQTITFGSLPNHFLTDAPFNVSATASSGLTVSFASKTSSTCRVVDNGNGTATITLVTVGTCTVAATQAGNATFLAAPEVDQSFAILLIPQFTTFSQTELVVGVIANPASGCSQTACVSYVLPANTGSVAVQITGSLTGTIQFETSLDGGATLQPLTGMPVGATASSALTSAAITSGIWQFNGAGLPYIQVRASALSSGAPLIYIQASQAVLPKF